MAVSAVGIVISGKLAGDSFAPNAGSVTAFHEVLVLCAIVIAAGGVIGAIGIRNPDPLEP